MTLAAPCIQEPGEPHPEEASPSPTRVTTFRLGGVGFVVLSMALDGEDVMAELSPAERVVATLAAAGMANAAIARCRGTSIHTVANQMVSTLRKLRIGSRYELAARLARCPVGTSEP
jgi:DNA-binding CsgD family transcriptional regulator